MSFSGSVEKQVIAGPSRLPAIMSEAQSAAQSSNATSKTLGTEELLLLVLEKVLVHDRLSLLKVSKKWNAITSSIGYVVKPTSLDTFEDSLTLLENLAPSILPSTVPYLMLRSQTCLLSCRRVLSIVRICRWISA